MFPLVPPPAPPRAFHSFPPPSPHPDCFPFFGAAARQIPPPPRAAVPCNDGVAGAGHQVVTPPMLGIGLQIRPVTAANYEAELDLIAALLPRYPVVAVDTEYPGTVHRPPPGTSERGLAPQARYALVKANVDELPAVQFGLTLCDEHGNLPVAVDGGCRAFELAWEVTFSDFDARRGRHAPESVAFLRSQGVDLDLARARGVSSAAFAAKLAAVLSSTAAPRQQLTWVAFGGAYDFAYLVKMLSGGKPPPATWHEFIAEVKDLLGGKVFDAKYMVEHSGRADVFAGGLRGVATCLGVPPIFLAGEKSHTACRIYTTIRRHFIVNGDVKRSSDEDRVDCFDRLIDGFHTVFDRLYWDVMGK